MQAEVANTQVFVMDWVDEFTLWLESNGLGSATVGAYLADVRVFSGFYQEANGQPFGPELLTSLDLREFRAWSIERQCAPSTWNRRMASLKTLCEWAKSSHRVNYDPWQGMERMEQVELAPRWLDKNEYSRFMRQVERSLNQARTPFTRRQALRDQAMVALMAYAGLREAEVVGLRVMDVVLSERKGSVLVRLGKGEKRRAIPLGKEARRALEMWLRELGSENPDARLFVGKGGVPLTVRGVQKVVAQLGAASGVEVTPHQLRHTAAKRMLDKGTPLTVIQKILGHKKLETTARYVQPGWSDLEDAVENL